MQARTKLLQFCAKSPPMVFPILSIDVVASHAEKYAHCSFLASDRVKEESKHRALAHACVLWPTRQKVMFSFIEESGERSLKFIEKSRERSLKKEEQHRESQSN
jgi:hypothetical protein